MNPPSSGLGSFPHEGPDVSPGKSPGADRRFHGNRRDPGALGRLVSVFHAPGRTFAELARSPTIAAALIATALAGAFQATVVSRATDLDAMARHAFERAAGADPGVVHPQHVRGRPATLMFESTQGALRLTRNFAPVLGAVGALISPLAAAAVFLLVFGLLGAQGSYRVILATVVHAGWPAVATSSLLTGLVAWVSYPLTPERAEAPLRSSLASVLGGLDGAAQAVASRMDLFLAWEIVLTGIGLAIVLGVTRGRSFAVVVSLWALVTAVVVGMALAMSAMSRSPSAPPDPESITGERPLKKIP